MATLKDAYSDAYEDYGYDYPVDNSYTNLGIAGSEQVGSYAGTDILSGSGGAVSPKSDDEYFVSEKPNVQYDQYGVSSYSGPSVNAPSAAGDAIASFVASKGGTLAAPKATTQGVGSTARGSITQTGQPLSASSQNRATVTTRVSTQPMPTFKLPTYDEGAIKKARQKKLGPMTRELRMAVQQALSKSYENPAVRNQAVEAALRGYGVGLERAAAGAEAAAQQEYNQQYAREMQSAQAAFTNAMNAWQGSQINISTTTPFDVNNQADLDKIKTMFSSDATSLSL